MTLVFVRHQGSNVGRKDQRCTQFEAAQAASNSHPHWKAEPARLQPRLVRNKSIVAIARKLIQFIYQIGNRNRPPPGQSTRQFAHQQLDSLQLGAELQKIPWRPKKKPIPLPPSSLPQQK